MQVLKHLIGGERHSYTLLQYESTASHDHYTQQTENRVTNTTAVGAQILTQELQSPEIRMPLQIDSKQEKYPVSRYENTGYRYKVGLRQLLI
jgi:hypothetical protein